MVSPGKSSAEYLHKMSDIYFKDGVEGLSVIDIGCWDGFNSFEAKRRGAKRVLATDHFAWSEHCWGDRSSFELAREILKLDVEDLVIDLLDISVQSVGQFDVMLFLGVFCNLKNPFLALEMLAPVCIERIVLETHLDALDISRPAMVFYPTTELANDHTNWWGPNPSCVEAMLKSVGFGRVDYTPNPEFPNQGVFHGYRV